MVEAMDGSHTPDVDFGAKAHDLEQGDLLRAPVTGQVADQLPVPAGASVADIGCGTGEMVLRLAQRVGPRGRVFAVDREPNLLRRVRERAEAAGFADRVVPVQSTIAELSSALPAPVTLVWAGNVVHHCGDQAEAIGNLAGLLAPGGTLAIAEGAPAPKRLPWDVGVGRPGLEARLEAALAEWFTAMRAGLPGSVRDPRGWPAMLRAAGLADVTAQGWLLHLPAPLSEAQRHAVLEGLAGRVERATPWLGAQDQASWRRLLDPASPDWLGLRDDLELIAVEVVYTGTLPPS